MLSSFFYLVLGSFAISISNYAMTITLRKKATIGGYLSIFFFVTFLSASYLNHIFSFQNPFSLPMASLGGITGLLMIVLMFGIGRSLQRGPSALSFAFLNSGSIIPPILMALLFGAAFGFSVTFANLLGMGITVAGLFWAARNNLKGNLSFEWLLFALFIFLFQGLLLTLYQWRCLIITEGLPYHLLIPFHCTPQADLWFMPALFFTAALVQLFIFYISEKRMQSSVEGLGGIIGGIANGLGTFFVLRATWIATPEEKAMLFPTFAVLVILICSFAGRLFYKERINWLATVFLILGILIGTLL